MKQIIVKQIDLAKRIRIRALYLAIGIAIGYTTCLYLAGGLVSAG